MTALIPTSWTCCDTILDSLDKETVDSIYADWGNQESKLSTTEFDFDYKLINTRAYRRALAQVQAKRSHELPRRELETPAQEFDASTMEPVEDLIDLSCEPSEQATETPPYRVPKSYTGLAGLQFRPINLEEEVNGPTSLDTGQTAGPMNTRMTGHLRESGLPFEGPPEVTATSRIDRASDIVSDEPLDGSPMWSYQGPNIGDSSLLKCLADLEAEHGDGRRRRASPRGSGEISDEVRKSSVRAKVPGKNANDSRYESCASVYTPDYDTRPRRSSIVRRSRPKVKQRQRSKSTDSTKVNPGTPLNTKSPRLLKTVEDAIQGLIAPELNAKREKAQRGRRFTEIEISRYTSSC